VLFDWLLAPPVNKGVDFVAMQNGVFEEIEQYGLNHIIFLSIKTFFNTF